MNSIVCVGEQLYQREAGVQKEIVTDQLAAIYKSDLKDTKTAKLVIAYEPVWAIGTGKVATPEQAQEMHLHIRNWIRDNVSSEVSDTTPILYGGSVNEKNYSSLKAQSEIDGFLVGGASLKPEFVNICK